MTLEDLISMTLEDLMPSHVYIYVCVVSLITKLFSVNFSLFAYLSLYASVRIKLFPKVFRKLRICFHEVPKKLRIKLRISKYVVSI